MNNQQAHLRIEELERAKQRLEQEVQANRRRLQLERLAAQQVTLPAARGCGWRSGAVGGEAGLSGEKPGCRGRSRAVGGEAGLNVPASLSGFYFSFPRLRWGWRWEQTPQWPQVWTRW